MPETKGRKVKGMNGRAVRRPLGPVGVNGAGACTPRVDDYAYVVQDDQPAFLLVPVEDYERLVKAEMIQSAIRKVTERDPDKVKWVKAEDFAMKLASERIVEARKAAGLSQKQLGQKLGMPQSQISRIERSPDHTTVRTIQKIARALGVDVSAFVGYCLPHGRRKRG